ncbi:MAG: hypothetical protein COU27_01910 [Candidatus Levybacteria bacterium CG10_big_fil_rev_8_21_14_0_10_36_7]|nr:MAG: hypothetical protein COU27_01910 [Candidatus Levybacteria bacterium CG10_big_fil_rev_8_21_14_0_10_36_7]
MKKFFQFLFKEFVYNGHLQAIGSASIVYVSMVALKMETSWMPVIAAYFIFQIIYWYDRLRGIKTDYATNFERSRHLESYLERVPFLIVLWLFILILFLVDTNLPTKIFSSVILIFGLLYPIYFKNLTRKIFIFKNIYVGGVFGLMVLYPFLWTGQNLFSVSVPAIIILILFVLSRGLVMQVLLDIKDVNSDAKEGLKTFSVVHGPSKTFNFLGMMNFLSVTPIFFALIFLPDLFSRSIAFLSLMFFYSLFVFNLIKREKFYGYILASLEFIFWAILVSVGKIW